MYTHHNINIYTKYNVYFYNEEKNQRNSFLWFHLIFKERYSNESVKERIKISLVFWGKFLRDV